MKNFRLTHRNISFPNLLGKEAARQSRRDKGFLHVAISLAIKPIFLALISLTPIQSAHAICVPNIPGNFACLADQPIQSAVSVKPNIMFLLDNSGSMASEYMPDSATSTSNCFKNYQYNSIYYNPNIDYTAAVPKNAMNVSMGSQAWPTVQTDPFLNPASTINLSTSFQPEPSISTSGANAAQPAFYYKYTGGGSPGTTCQSNASYTKITVSATSCVVSGDVTSCPTGADERVNFANWYSYYRTRILMMKSGMATAFATLDDKFRVGFHTINNPGSTGNNGGSLTIQDFSGGGAGTPKGNWYAMLFKMSPTDSTPLQQALVRVGEYYAGNAQTGLPIDGAHPDPVQYSCQKNFTIMSTDGGWNGPNTGKGDWDNTVPTSMPIKDGNTVYNISDTGLTPGTQFPRPFYEGATANTDTLADIGMYYWVRDLRTAGPVSTNNVPTSSSDPAYWQHMNLFTMGLGLNGTLNFPGDYDALVAGTKNWPVTPNGGNTSTTNPAKFDDLWHAAVNGHGQYYKATDPISVANSLTAALRAISDAPTYGVGPSSSTNDFKSPDQTDFSTYVSSYRLINWSGDVKKYTLDPTTGLKTGSPLWSAAKQLDSKVNPGLTSTVSTTAYTTRNIVTRQENGTVIAFDYPSLSTTQKTALCYKVSPGSGPCVAGDTSLVDYLRGDAKYEGDYGIGSARFRNRHDITETSYYKRDLLGTIVNAQPAYVAAENRGYTDPGYLQFANSTASRTPMLYVPANDGMVHAFNAATGDEVWAYIPSFLITTANDELGKEKGLRALSYQDGGAPAYNQHFYVDATPDVAAVDFSATGGPGPYGTNDWHSILVGGLGKGGKGYYALDVTTPALPNDMASAKSKVLWEFPSAADPSHSSVISGGKMGYSFGKPVIAKTIAFGWVVIVPSGFNNTDPSKLGYLFVLNAKTGALLETLQTPVPAPGMAYVTTLVHTGVQEVHGVYSGDLNGSLWRFDFNVPPLTNNATGLQQRVWQIFSSSPATPIGSEVDVEVDAKTKSRWVFFGTGQYLDVPDRSTTDTQYLVALKDGVAPDDPSTDFPSISGVVPSLSGLTPVSNLTTGISEPPVGWKYQLPNSISDIPSTRGQRVVSKPVADLQTVLFTTLIPTTDPCSPGSSSYVYALDYSSGRNRLRNGDGTPIPPIYSAKGVAGVSIQMAGKTATSNGTPQVIITGQDGKIVTVAGAGGVSSAPQLDDAGIPGGTRHVGWREVADEN